MRIYKTANGGVIEKERYFIEVAFLDWDKLFQVDDLDAFLSDLIRQGIELSSEAFEATVITKPIESQEIWAAGVTYYRSRTARMEESVDGGNVYDRVYAADRPELFFKATPARAVGPGEDLIIRKDSTWDVPEPELTLAINHMGKIIGYTIGNDMSSRSIEGENPLYLPQAKMYEKCAAVGPCIYITENPLDSDTKIKLAIMRNGDEVFKGEIGIDQMKRKPGELVEYLFRECEFPSGCLLMTGTGIVPPNDFTLAAGDEVRITIKQIGTLMNTIARKDQIQ